MAQHDYTVANASGSTVRADINNALQAIVTVNSDNTEPSTMYAGQLWHDTGNNVLKIRNQANTSWLRLPIATNANDRTAGGLSVQGDLVAENVTCDDVTQSTGSTANLRDTVILGDVSVTGAIIKINPCIFVGVINNATLSDTVPLDLTYNYEEIDTDNNLNTSTGLFTAPVDGVYSFNASVRFDGASTWLDGDRASLLLKRSTDGGTSWTSTSVATGAISMLGGSGVTLYN